MTDAGMPTPSIIMVGQTPPPWHGQAVATKMLFDHRWDGMEVRPLRMAYSDEMEAIGRIRLQKVLHLWYLIRETRRLLNARPGTILFYPPTSPHWVPFIRDILYLWMVRRHAGKTIFMFHAGGFAGFVNSSRLRRWLGRAYANPDLCLEVAVESPSPHKALGCSNWTWTPYGVDVPRVVRRSWPGDRPVRVLFVGSLQEGKGALELIRTAALLKARASAPQFSFVLVGRWFSEAFRLEAEGLRRALGVENLVEFTGQKTGAAKWEAYAAADIFFFPSHYAAEAFPIVIIEALGSGLPVVSTTWRGIPSIVEGSGVARLSPPRSPDAFADALCATAAELVQADRIGQKARSFYESRYTPAHFLSRIQNAIAPLLARGRVAGTPPASPAATVRAARRPSRIRILQLFNQYLERGGEELWVDRMLEFGPPTFDVHSLRFQSRTWVERGRPSIARQACLLWNNPDSRRRLREEVARVKPDVLLFHNVLPVGSLGLYDEARALGLPLVQYIHNFRPFSPSGTLWVKGRIHDGALNGHALPEIVNAAWEGSLARTALLAWYLHRFRASARLEHVDHWIAVSDFMRSKFVDAGIPADRIDTLRHCWKPDADLEPASEGDYYLFLGRLVPEKGILVLLDAWSFLEQRLGPACPRLIIAGTGPEEARVHKLAIRSRQVRFTGFVTGREKADLILHCRALLVPSIWWEPLGLTVYEAYERGRPVLAAQSGGLMETVLHGTTGYLHEPGDIHSLANSVVRIEADGPERRAAMGRNGREWLETEADPGTWRTRLHQLLSALLLLRA